MRSQKWYQEILVLAAAAVLAAATAAAQNSCQTTANCNSGQVCEVGECMVPACGVNAECAIGQICSSGTCVAPPSSSSVSACDVTPNPGQIEAGATLTLQAIAKGSSGLSLPFEGFTWTSSGPATVSGSGTVTGAGTGDATITASAGTTNCTATVTTFATVASGQLRVVVEDADANFPIQGAIVVVDGTRLASTTDLHGQVAVNVGAGPHDVHVFATGHDYVSILHTTNTDLLVPLAPSAPLASQRYFQGTMNAADFADLSVQGERVHLAIFGSSIPGSPIDIGLKALVGQPRPVTVQLGKKVVQTQLPSGLVIGIDQVMFSDQYQIYAPPGKRALWGFGGNLNSTAAGALQTLLTGSARNIDFAQLVSQVLPLVGKLQAGAITDAEVGLAPITISVPLNTRLRLAVTPTMPRLPKQDGNYLGGAVVIGGALDYPQGFVPLGITGGLSQKDSAGHNTGMLLDPTCNTSQGSDPCATGKLPMRLAPQGNGLEGSNWAFLSLAANLDGLQNRQLGLSALVKPVSEIFYVVPPAPGTTIDFTARGYMSLPGAGSVTLTRVTRSFTVAADADTSTKMYRFRLSNHAHLNWSVWMPSTATAGGAIAVTLPDPSTLGAGLVDPLQDALGDDGKLAGPSALLAAVSTGDASTFATVTGFATPRLDQLGASIDAFTLVSVPID